uniref:Bromo domain-containing protein n=1 Tax=Timema poppense TaxID=170557 RepID=A0A7R9CWQ0_TIMPO|nr:unnamed protein product [Timema poppensis]
MIDNHGHQSLEITPPQQPAHIGRMHVQKADNLTHVYHPTLTKVEAPIASANAPRTPDGLSFPGTGSSLLHESPHHSRSTLRVPIGKSDLLTPYKIQSDGGHLSYANESYYVDFVGTNPITYIRPAPTNNVNTVTSMQTSWVEKQPSDNVRMSMDLESRGLLQCVTDSKDTQKEESNNMQRNASHLSNVCQSKLPVSIEMNNDLKSDSTFSIECQVMGERMVSALCTTPVKDTEERLDFQNEKDLHVKNWLNSISFDGMSPNTDASYIMGVKEDDCVSDSSTVCVPVQEFYKDNEVETNVNHDITKTTAAIQILPPHNNRRVPLTSVQRTVVAYDEDAVMVPMHVGTIPPQSGNSLSIVEDSTPAMSKITYMDLQPSPKPDLRTELVDDELDGNYIQKGTYNPPSKSSMSKSTSVLTSKSSNCASVPDSFISVQETNTSENIMRLRKDDHFTDAIPISYPMYNMFNTIKNECDTTWKRAVAEADTVKDPIETLVISLQRVSLNDSQNKEDDKINKEYKLDQDQSLKKKTICSNEVSPEEKRKCEPIKTDNWLIKTLANASKLHGESCLKNSENQYKSQIINSSNTKGDTVEEESQILESDLTCNEIISADLRVLVTPIETTSSGRKVSREKKKNISNKQGEETLVWAPVEKRGLCGARKRRFRDRAAERMAAEIDEEDDSRTAVIGKGYAIEKERWGIWYSSTRRRGLSKMARDKLEAILNMIWNMEEAEFIKYAVVSTSIPDYYLIVKHPMDLSDIARKLRNIIYETIEQFVHDFRLIFYNIRLYNKKGAILSQRFDELLEDNFTGWEFKSITGSPRELNTNPTLRYTAFDNHRKSTAKHLSQHNSQASSRPHLTTKFKNDTWTLELSPGPLSYRANTLSLSYPPSRRWPWSLIACDIIALIVPTPMTVFSAYGKDAVSLLYQPDIERECQRPPPQPVEVKNPESFETTGRDVYQGPWNTQLSISHHKSLLKLVGWYRLATCVDVTIRHGPEDAQAKIEHPNLYPSGAQNVDDKGGNRPQYTLMTGIQTKLFRQA